ncbi:uncharacterized protein LOC134204724 [Armigeres subalbatus]|uniref:uncharacterized protein LOC134204724 n=1 Tax=Armigeres subalbatus TaxID=124917 RepID=UPI002ED47AEC
MSTQAIQSAASSVAESVPRSSVVDVEECPRVVASASAPQSREDVFLLTVLVKVVDAYGQDHIARVLLDSASQPNLITDRLARRLHLKRTSVNVTIQGAGNTSKKVKESIFARIKSRNDSFECGVDLLLMDTLTADLPAQDICIADWQIPQNLSLADPMFNKSQQIDMVLGAKHYHSFFPSTARLQLADNLPTLVDSVFGWVVTGSASIIHPIQRQSITPSVVAVSMPTLEECIERFWKTEELTVDNNYSVEECHCEDFFQSTTSRDETGRYIVRLPRKPDFDAMLGESKIGALRRFEQLERRLERDQKLKEEYHDFMREYLFLGHMRLVELDDGNRTYYLPHHPVIKEASTTTKVTRALQHVASDEGNNKPVAGQALRKNFNVDDFIGGEKITEEAIQLREELANLLLKGGFMLRKWTSNRLEVLQGLQDDQIGTQSSLQFTPNESIKALGIRWEPESDTLRFDSPIQQRNEPPTKRSILSDIARLFDPLGLIAPIVVRAKILMQELWSLSCDWDDPVPHIIRLKWEKFRLELPRIATYRIDRYAFLPDAQIELHTFADASTSAYGACTYVRCENALGTVRIRLLASKSKVAPLKRLTIARLELCACVLAAHLHHRIKQAIHINVSASYFWSDSAVCLYWLRAPPSAWKTFVANRVSEVQHFTHGSKWNHISGSENPADLVSRGMSVEDFLQSEDWKHGPSWLAHQQSSWPISNLPAVSEDILETKSVVASIQTITSINPWFLRWSSYTRLLHTVGYCLRFVTRTRSKARTQSIASLTGIELDAQSLTVQELVNANALLIRLAQQDVFGDEIKDLQRGNTVMKKSPIRRMCPFIDPEGILRVGGRLNLSQLPYQSKHPALLPKDHPFTRLIGEHYHRKLLHGGGRLLLSSIREEYWPLNGRRLVHSIVRNCFRCIRHRPQPAHQQIGQLPAARVIPSRPFSNTGVDYAGPLYMKPIHKRAAPGKSLPVHIYMLRNKGCPPRGAKRELGELFARFRSQNEQSIIASACTDQGITWHLTPPKAPHFGGLWEAAVKTAKRHLFRQLESAMNSRPLLPMSDDPNDLAALTPAHFLIGTSMYALPDPATQHTPVGALEHLQKLQHHVQKFWVHWRTEYLQEMMRDTKLAARNDEIRPGRMVILVDEMVPTTRWPLARITEVHPGRDRLNRVVSLRTAKGVIIRPITRICLLPCFEPVLDQEQREEEVDDPNSHS